MSENSGNDCSPAPGRVPSALHSSILLVWRLATLSAQPGDPCPKTPQVKFSTLLAKDQKVGKHFPDADLQPRLRCTLGDQVLKRQSEGKTWAVPSACFQLTGTPQHTECAIPAHFHIIQRKKLLTALFPGPGQDWVKIKCGGEREGTKTSLTISSPFCAYMKYKGIQNPPELNNRLKFLWRKDWKWG